MRTALTLTMSAVFALVTGVSWADDDVEKAEVVVEVVEDLDSMSHLEKADYYYQRYADTLEEARQAAEKGDWDEYNEIYKKAKYYRREYEFYRKGAAAPPAVVYRTYPTPEVRYEVYAPPRVVYHTRAPSYYYTPAPSYYYTPGVSLSFGYHSGHYYRPYRYRSTHHRPPHHYRYSGRSHGRGRSLGHGSSGRGSRGRGFRGGRRR